LLQEISSLSDDSFAIGASLSRNLKLIFQAPSSFFDVSNQAQDIVPRTEALITQIVKQQSEYVQKCREFRKIAKKLEVLGWQQESKYRHWLDQTKTSVLDLLKRCLQQISFKFTLDSQPRHQLQFTQESQIPPTSKLHAVNCPNTDMKSKLPLLQKPDFQSRFSFLQKPIESERIDFVNSVLNVFWHAWQVDGPFKRLVLNEIYIAANLDRPAYLGEIQMLRMDLIGEPPRFHSVALCPKEVYEAEGLDPDRDFLCEGDLDLKGGVGFKIKLEVKSYLTAPVACSIVVSKIRSRCRLCFSNQTNSFL
jgi:hypothetical protein